MVSSFFFPNRQLLLAVGLYQSGLWDASLKILGRVDCSGNAEPTVQKSAFKTKIRIHLRKKDWRNAQNVARIACQKYPLDPTLTFLLGLSYLLQGKAGLGEAHKCFEKVQQMAPFWGTNLKRHAKTLLSLGRVEDSILVLRRLVSQIPNCPKALRWLIMALRQRGNHQEANNLVRQARFLFPFCPRLSRLYQALQKPKPPAKIHVPGIIPFVRLFPSRQSPVQNGIVLRLEDHPKSRMMQAFSPTGRRRG